MSIPIVKVVGIGLDGEPKAIAVDGFGRIQTDGGGSSGDVNAINLVGVTARLDGVCDRLDTLISLLTPIINENQRVKVIGIDSNAAPPEAEPIVPSSRFNSNRNTFLVGAI